MPRLAVAGAQAPSDGHTVRIFPAQFVKPFVKTSKNDIIDAEAIAEPALLHPSDSFRGPPLHKLEEIHGLGPPPEENALES